MALATARTVAQDRDPDQAAPPPASQEPAPAPPPPPAQDQDQDQDADTNRAADDEFIPTEEIRADEEVTFPVDI
jgi:hypothetical protein